MKLWVAIDTKDPYKLPLYVANSAEDMAKRFHVTRTCVDSSAYYARKTGKERQFIRVEVDDE